MRFLSLYTYRNSSYENGRKTYSRIPILAKQARELIDYVNKDLLNGGYRWLSFPPFKSVLVIDTIHNLVFNRQPTVNLLSKWHQPF